MPSYLTLSQDETSSENASNVEMTLFLKFLKRMNINLDINSESEVNDIDHRLQAAHLLAREISNASTLLNSLVSVIVHIVCTQYSLPLRVYAKVYRAARKVLLQNRQLSITSARIAHQWLYVVTLTPGVNLNDAKILKSLEFMRKQKNDDREFTLGAIGKRPKKLREVVSSPEASVISILKHLERYLFVTLPSFDSIITNPIDLIDKKWLLNPEELSIFLKEGVIRRGVQPNNGSSVLTTKRYLLYSDTDSEPIGKERLLESEQLSSLLTEGVVRRGVQPNNGSSVLMTKRYLLSSDTDSEPLPIMQPRIDVRRKEKKETKTKGII